MISYTITFRFAEPTPAQIEILQLLAQGMNQNQVASVLGIKVDTTRMQLKLLRGRLAFNTVEQAVAVAALRGWIDVPS